MIELIEAGSGRSGARLRVSGDWTFTSMRAHASELRDTAAIIKLRPAATLDWDLGGVEAMDDAGAVWLASAMRGTAPAEIPEQYRGLIEQAALAASVPPAKQSASGLSAVIIGTGNAGLHFVDHMRDAVALLGQLALDAFRLARRPSEIPFFEISANIYRSGVTALPVQQQ